MKTGKLALVWAVLILSGCAKNVIPLGNDGISPTPQHIADSQDCYDKANAKYPNDNNGYNQAVTRCMKEKGYQ